MDRWCGRIALVTGASAGIGAAICRELVKHGMTVIGCARNVSRIEDIAKEDSDCHCSGSLVPIKCDLTNEAEILSMFDEICRVYGHLHLCVNNAGLCFDSSLLSGQTDQWRTMLEVNVLALCICTREAVKLMKNVEEVIIHLSSMFAYRIPSLAIYMYGGIKHMVKALTEGHRRELLSALPHIRVSSISPGLVETEIAFRCFRNNPEYAEELYKSIKCWKHGTSQKHSSTYFEHHLVCKCTIFSCARQNRFFKF